MDKKNKIMYEEQKFDLIKAEFAEVNDGIDEQTMQLQKKSDIVFQQIVLKMANFYEELENDQQQFEDLK